MSILPRQGRRPRLGDPSRMLVTYLRPQRLRVAGLAAMLLGSIGLRLFNPQILKQFIDSATHGASDRTLALAAGLFLAIALIQQAVSVVATYLSENVGWTATNAVRADLLRHCLHLDPSFHKTRTPGELIERIDGDATTLANFFSQLVIQVVGNLLFLAGVLLILWRIDRQIGLLMTSLVGLVFLTLSRLQALVTPLWTIALQQSAELYGFIEERLAGTEDIRSSGAQPYTMRGLHERMGKLFRTERRALLGSLLALGAAGLLLALAGAATLLLAARLHQTQGLTIGTIYSVVFYLGMLFGPLAVISRQAEDFQRASAGIARIQELLNTRSALDENPAECGVRSAECGIGDEPDGASAPGSSVRHAAFRIPHSTLGAFRTPHSAGPLSVTFRDVRFGYEAVGEPVLDHVSFHLAAGRVLGVLGRTGSGKTTLTRLLFRLYDPQAGAIELAGVDLRAVPLRDLRRRVGVVTQEVQLFRATIRDNLTLFEESIPDERILSAIEALGLQRWYQMLPQGLDTRLASGGGGLSAGEAQLLAFTRIFLRDPGLVILDEASSRLDPATEQLIERAVDRLLLNRTGIVIAHRLHTVHRADEILILEDGTVLEHGERRQLLRDTESRFSQLLQAGLEKALA